MKKILSTSMLTGAIFLLSSVPGFAAPYNAADKNPQTVAYYENGTHGIPDETGGNHVGTNMVKQNGNSGNFEAWFYGTFPAGDEGPHGHHLVWLVSKNGKCPPNATFVPQAYPGWGDYLVPGADYCVFDNEYHVQK